MYVSGFDGRGVQLVWEALFCVFGEGLGSLPVLATYRLLPWPCRLPDWEPIPECSAHALWCSCPMISMAVPLLPIEFITFGGWGVNFHNYFHCNLLVDVRICSV